MRTCAPPVTVMGPVRTGAGAFGKQEDRESIVEAPESKVQCGPERQ